MCIRDRTISEDVQKRLQEQAYRIVESIEVIGGTNVQFAHDPVSDRIVVIAVSYTHLILRKSKCFYNLPINIESVSRIRYTGYTEQIYFCDNK